VTNNISSRICIIIIPLWIINITGPFKCYLGAYLVKKSHFLSWLHQDPTFLSVILMELYSYDTTASSLVRSFQWFLGWTWRQHYTTRHFSPFDHNINTYHTENLEQQLTIHSLELNIGASRFNTEIPTFFPQTLFMCSLRFIQ